jgi:hypothetical protein
LPGWRRRGHRCAQCSRGILAFGVDRTVADARVGAGGGHGRHSDSVDQIAVIVMVCRFLREKVDAVLRDAALPDKAMLSDVPRHLLPREMHLCVKGSAQALALVVVGEAIEQIVAQLLQVLRRDGRGVDRILALRAIKGVGIVEQRILPGCDETVQFAFDPRVVGDLFLARDPGIGRRRRRRGLRHRPVRNDEVSHALENKRVGENRGLRSLYPIKCTRA